MRTSIVVVALACMTLLLASAADGSGANSSSPSAQYIEALGVANRLLTAWAGRDPDLRLMSERVLAAGADSARPDLRGGLREYMTGVSNPHHVAFEIFAGRMTGADRVSFPVRLFELYAGESTGLVYADTLEVVLQSGAWRVDRLPRTFNTR